MNDSTLTCKDEQRRQQVRRRHLNGLDYLEVGDNQRSLCVHFLGPVPTNITKENLRIEGGQRIRNIQVTGVEVEPSEDPSLDGCLRVFVDQSGDFSFYTLQLVNVEGFDPRYTQLKFSFKVGCPNDIDCKSAPICPPPTRIEPDINYLAKDYASFRQLILDRLALNVPDWQERHVPDLGITLVEVLAYVGDYLSYYQDAVATEAYLDTARQRISVRRHARLVDYPMHEGCNARTWVWLETDQDTPINLSDIYFITHYQNAPSSGTILSVDDLNNIPAGQYEVFEPVFLESTKQIQIYKNKISLYSWGDRSCCLPQGTISATLLDQWIAPTAVPPQELCEDDEHPTPPAEWQRQLQSLQVGDILIFEEVKGAKTGNPADADITHRHAVRLTHVERGVDIVYPDTQFPSQPTPVVEITWDIADALPFPVCISAIGLAPECKLSENITVVRGNVILVDHGYTLTPEDLGTVAAKEATTGCEAAGEPADIATTPALFRPRLQRIPLTFRQPPPISEQIPGSQIFKQNPQQAVAQITRLISNSTQWTPQLDLLGSRNRDRNFVVEIDDDGYAHLRFGDGELGQQPEVGNHFFATYRIGNGIAGNIGADTIAHVVFRQNRPNGLTLQPHNPLPAQGGTDPQPLSEVKLFAPRSFRKELQRAIAADDYAQIVMRDFSSQVQRAAATLRWTGSWYEVLVVIDPLASQTDSRELLNAIAQHLYRYRRIGHDVVVKPAIYVPLDIALTVCVQPNYLRGHLKADLLNAFSDRLLADGRRGFFHPDNLTFGTGIALSQLVATAQKVSGVESVSVTRLQRLYVGENGEIEQGILPLNPLEVAQLANDPNFPENGKFELFMRGGR
ncbi:putative baseplate assembly protein [Calothrix sp. PCC 7507]|uniref:putative baseplate assembly protein n=1 Tax=Calothrix sp. PCC 7507 TaxID=99598 RepID=UPI00029ED47E|nr:putative baseplate assembly protein [Calothrix sp. PCC 7507]AFY34128.1 hypothetical protein Cal7507_3737 [Calothrix sp. PCC 7507]